MRKIKKLKNGLTVVTLKMPRMRSAAIGVWVSAGGRHETLKNRGVSHFLEHMAFKGTRSRSALEIKNSIEGVGGSLNAFTTEELTCYLSKVPGRHADLALNVLGDMAMNPLLAEADIEKERMVILEEVKMYRDQPDQYVHELLGELVWPDHIMGVPLIGTHESIKGMTRNAIASYMEAHYLPANITVAACGDIDEKEVLSLCGNIFSKDTKAKKKAYEKLKIDQHKARSVFFRRDTEQDHLAIGFHGPSRASSRRYVMSMLNMIMGANMSSRLFHEVREERGLAYAISSHARFFEDGGLFTIEAGIDNRKIVKAVEVVLKELSKVKKGPITRAEWERAREYYQGSLEFALEQTTGYMLWLGERIVTRDEPLDPRRLISLIRKITIDDMIGLARSVFTPANLNLALIGPVASSDERALKEMIGSFR